MPWAKGTVERWAQKCDCCLRRVRVGVGVWGGGEGGKRGEKIKAERAGREGSGGPCWEVGLYPGDTTELSDTVGFITC